jgi:hypothetical protein
MIYAPNAYETMLLESILLPGETWGIDSETGLPIIIRMEDSWKQVRPSRRRGGRGEMKLLASNNKLRKQAADLGYHVLGLSLLPGDKSGRELCPYRGRCFDTCLDTAGRGATPAVQQARALRSALFLEAPRVFLAQLDTELSNMERSAKRRGLAPAVRLNVISDVAWERKAPGLFRDHPTIQFYDYTKAPGRAWRALRKRRGEHEPRWPGNYDLTYSWSEEADPEWTAQYLNLGGRVSYAPFAPWPTSLDAYPRVDGDAHDLTFLHDPGVVLTLEAKGRLRRPREVTL